MCHQPVCLLHCVILSRVSSGGDPECQLEAAACVTNLSVGPAAQTQPVAGLVGGYLVTLSASASHVLQVRQTQYAPSHRHRTHRPLCSAPEDTIRYIDV